MAQEPNPDELRGFDASPIPMSDFAVSEGAPASVSALLRHFVLIPC